MTDTNNGKQINPMVAGVTGAVIGAGVAAVTTGVLSNKKTRDKVFHTVSSIRKKVMDSMENMEKGAMEQKESIEHRLRLGKRVRKGVK